MRSLFSVLLLLLVVFPPCLTGCSSQRSEKDSERIEAENEGADSGSPEGEESIKDDE